MKKKFVIDIEIKEQDNHFTKYQYDFTDPEGKGMNFSLFLNDERVPTVFTTQDFVFHWFNSAEGASPAQLLNAAEKCLTGELSFKKRILKGYTLEFSYAGFSASGKNKKGRSIGGGRLSGYKRGYQKK